MTATSIAICLIFMCTTTGLYLMWARGDIAEISVAFSFPCKFELKVKRKDDAMLPPLPQPGQVLETADVNEQDAEPDQNL